MNEVTNNECQYCTIDGVFKFYVEKLVHKTFEINKVEEIRKEKE